MKSSWYGLVERYKNFHGYVELSQEEIERMEPFFIGAQAVYEYTVAILDENRELSGEQLLRMVFRKIYHNTIIDSKLFIKSDDFEIFDDDSPLYEDVFNACFFTTLAMFIHASKRVKGMPIGDFVYKHSPNKYNAKDSPNYVKVGKYADTTSQGHQLFEAEKTQMRKMRHRLLSGRPVYNQRSEWSAMPASSEHEWAFYNVLNNDSFDDDLRDTYKRIGNLFNDVSSAIHKLGTAPDDEDCSPKLEEAYKKFLRKLEKIDYVKILRLHQKILSHLCENKSYYGINIYRFEKLLRLYNLTNEVKYLLECKSEEEENRFLKKTIILDNIYFPKVYQSISALEQLDHMISYALIFNPFLDAVIQLGLPFIDAIVEQGYFGENWEGLFIDTINGMTESVFYNPDEIDYTVTPESQGKYVKRCSAYVRGMLDVVKALSPEDRRNIRASI